MSDDLDHARDQTQSQAAFFQHKALMLFERICKLNLVMAEVSGTRLLMVCKVHVGQASIYA